MNNSEEEKALKQYLSAYNPKVQEICLHLRSFVSEKHPEANQLVYDGYNAVSIVFSLSSKLKDAFCHLAVYKNHVNFGFNRGAEIENPELKLEGSGKLIRHYQVSDLKNMPEKEFTALLQKAMEITYKHNPDLQAGKPNGRTIIRPTSAKKLRP